MTGTIVNAIGILAGGILGLVLTRQPSMATQMVWRFLLGLLVLGVGLNAVWQSLHGPFLYGCQQMTVALLALILGNLLGKLFRLQISLNRWGEAARRRLTSSDAGSPPRSSDSLVLGTILFCLSPVGVLGALHDGLLDDWKILGVKALMDGLAVMALVPTLGWGLMLAVVPVMALQGTLTILAQALAPVLSEPELEAIGITGGLMVFSVALVALEVKKVKLADYLPSLVVAPLLTWLWW